FLGYAFARRPRRATTIPAPAPARSVVPAMMDQNSVSLSATPWAPRPVSTKTAFSGMYGVTLVAPAGMTARWMVPLGVFTATRCACLNGVLMVPPLVTPLGCSGVVAFLMLSGCFTPPGFGLFGATGTTG